MTAIAYPYMRLSSDALQAGPWCDSTGEPLGEFVAHWDSAASLTLTREMRLNTERAAKQLLIPERELKLSAVVALATGGGAGMRERAVVARAELSALAPCCVLKFDVSGRQVAQALALITDIVLAEVALSAGPLAPQRVGLRLWSDRANVQLETAGSRFPIESVDFGVMFPGHAGDALWHLDSGADLEHAFAGAVRLYINARQSAFVERVAAGDPVVLRLIVGQMMAQVMRQALEDETFDPAAVIPGSIGATAAAWIELAFPGYALDAVKGLSRAAPASFETAAGALAAAMVSDA
jgi:hypothetical protein